MNDSNIFYENLKSKVVERVGNADGIERLGLMDDVPLKKLNTPLDTLSHYLAHKLALGKKMKFYLLVFICYLFIDFVFVDTSERDLVVLRHDVGIRYPSGKREERGINFVVYGESQASGGHSAMAKTVGFPAAIATRMILDGEIQKRGVVLPFSEDIYRPILSRLRAEGLHATETVKVL